MIIEEITENLIAAGKEGDWEGFKKCWRYIMLDNLK
jgi:hypothetical protein